MLSIVAMSNNVFEEAPRTGYLKAIDVWMLGCFSITFIALVEFVVVLYIQKHFEKDQVFICDVIMENLSSNPQFPQGPNKVHAKFTKKGRMWRRTSERVDSLFRVLVPLIFVLFFAIFIAAVRERGYDNGVHINRPTESLDQKEVTKNIIQNEMD